MNYHESGNLREKHKEASSRGPLAFHRLRIWGLLPAHYRIRFAKKRGVDSGMLAIPSQRGVTSILPLTSQLPILSRGSVQTATLCDYVRGKFTDL